MWSIVEGGGVGVVHAIFAVADLLKAPYTPGLVSALLLLWLAVSLWIVLRSTYRARSALREVLAMLGRPGSDQAFRQTVIDVSAELHEKWEEGPDTARRAIARAWSEYRETTIDRGEHAALRNAVRPMFFFNPDDLQFLSGWWKSLPGLFVSIGLLCTFLGLVAALRQTGAALQPENTQDALTGLLTIASAKFVMSLTGLFCSIVLTGVLRRSEHQLQQAVGRLCESLEERLTFISLEELAFAQVEAIEKQNEHMTRQTIELVEKLGVPMEQIPQAVGRSVAEAMAPIMERVGQVGAEGMGDVVKSLSERITQDVGTALNSASAELRTASEQIASLVDKMDGSSQRMGVGMEAAIHGLSQAAEGLNATMSTSASTVADRFGESTDRMLAAMNGTLEAIRSNTASGAAAMAEAAKGMADAARDFREQIELATREASTDSGRRMTTVAEEVNAQVGRAGGQVIEGLDGLVAQLAERSQEIAQGAGKELLEPIGVLREELDRIAERIGAGASALSRFSTDIERGAGAANDVAASLARASDGFRNAAAPVTTAAERIEAASRASEAAIREVSESLRTSSDTVARQAADTLQLVREILGAEKRAVESAFEAIEDATGRFQGILDSHDRIEGQLAEAFETFRGKVQSAVEVVRTHSNEVHEKYAGALDKLNEVVDQVREFSPES